MQNKKQFVIGVDAGGTKTEAALADLSGTVIKTAKAGPASLRANGIKASCRGVADAVAKVMPKEKNAAVASTFIGFPAFAEEYRTKKREILKELAKNSRIKKIFSGCVGIGSDQAVAFRAGTDAKDGIAAIAGTGCVVHGWNGAKEVKVSGWGWLSNEGSGFWIGKEAFLAILKSHDGRGEGTALTKMVFEKFRLKNIDALMAFAYKDPLRNLPLLSIICNEAAKTGDRVAQAILREAGQEIACSVGTAARQLGFSNGAKIPLVLVGGTFKSKFFLDAVVADVSNCGIKFAIIKPNLPALGAAKIALDNING